MAESTSPELHNIGSLPMCIAVDRSGSTFGITIKAELDVVRQICHLRQDKNHRPVTLLPWCDQADKPIVLPEGDVNRRLKGVEADGGTDPAVLYQDKATLEALRAAGIWVLMTDGQIRDSLVENFATKTTSVGLHNRPCIIVVFGSVTSGRPAACDISVGIAIYAVVPDCIFLFHDVATGVVRILQAKGRFKQLLPKGQVRLVVSQYTAWAELPRIAYEDLFRIEVATVRELQPGEIALQEGLIVNMSDMLAGKLDESTVEKVLKDRDNRRSIVLASKTMGSGKTLKTWLKAQQKAVPDKTAELEDVGGRAQRAISDLLAALGGNPMESTVADLRGSVRAAHEANLDHFWQKKHLIAEEQDGVRRHNERMEAHCGGLMDTEDTGEDVYSAGACGYGSGATTPVQATTSTSFQTTQSPWKSSEPIMSSLSMVSPSRIPMPTWQRGGKNPYRRRSSFSRLNDMGSSMNYDGGYFVEDDEEEPPLFLAGYRRADPVKQFKGRCMLCHTTSALALLLKLPPAVQTLGFPIEGEAAKLAFPLAMGNFPELDVLSYFVCCDACALHLVRLGTCPTSDVIISAICLVSLPQNTAVMLEDVEQAVRGRFDAADLLPVFVAMLDARLVQNELRDATQQLDKDLFREAARWTLSALSATLEIPASLSPTFLKTSPSQPLQGISAVFSMRHFTEPAHVDNVDLLLLRYPIAGFVVLLRLLRLTRFISEEEAAGSAQVLLFQRIAFHLLETEINRRMAGEAPLPLAEMLDLRPETPGKDDRSMASIAAGLKKCITVSELVHHRVLDQDSLKALQSDAEFKTLDENCGPALAVFLHWMARSGVPYLEPVTCFNGLKTRALMKNVVKAPLAISDGLAADYIGKIWERT